MNKLVSIVMPIYNVEKYLERSILCAINQTYAYLQIILVDDGSRDNSGKICDAFAKKDSRITVIHKLNGGLSDARNAGLKEAKGEYVYFFDPDDYIELNLVEVCVREIEIRKSDFVVFNYEFIKHKEREKKSVFKSLDYELKTNIERINFIYDKLLNYEIGWEAWNRFYQRKFLMENELFFWDNNEIFAEDLAFMISAVPFTKKITVLQDVLYYYVLRDDSIMGQVKEPPINKVIRLSEKVIEQRTIWNIKLEEAQKIGIKVVLNEIDKCKNNKELVDILSSIVEDKKRLVQQWILSVLTSKNVNEWEYQSLKRLLKLLETNFLNKKDINIFLFYRKIYRISAR